MAHKLIITLLFCTHILSAQFLEFSGGLSKYDYSLSDEYKYSNSADTRVGYNFLIGVDGVSFKINKIEDLTFRFTFGISRSSAKFNFRTGGQGGGHITKAETQKKVFTFGIYPINIKKIKNLELNIGINYLRTVSSYVVGSSTAFGAAGNNTVDLALFEGDIFAKRQIGPAVRLAYTFKLSDKILITPQYNYYIGITPEFRRSISTTFNQNHFIGIGIKPVFI